MKFIEKQEIFENLNKIINNKTVLYLAVSGGPDSILMLFLITEFFKTNNFDLNNIIILHYNHGFRKNSDNEERILTKKYNNYNFYSEKYNGNIFDERTLRKNRYEFFSRYYKKNENTYLVTGHNLTDRIETTFLNMLRGSSVEGFLNMSFCDYINNNIGEFDIIRPLLSISKTKILQIINNLGLDYFVDETNTDNSISKRNFIRNEILSKFEEISNINEEEILFYKSFNEIYSNIDNKKNNIKIIDIHYPSFIPIEKLYLIKDKIYIDDIIFIIKKLGIYTNISKKLLLEIKQFIYGSNSGYKLLNGFYIFKSHGNLYFFKGVKEFWENYVEKELEISNKGNYNIEGFVIEIDNQDYIGGKIRFPQENDIFKGKKLMKYLINKKVPVFLRKYVPIIEKDGKIVQVLIDKIKKGIID